MPVLRRRRSRRVDAAASIALTGIVPLAAAALALACVALVTPASASAAPPAPGSARAPIKWVDASGRVHYTDRQPSPQAMGQGTSAQSIPARAPMPAIGDPTLPWALRSAALRYPVTLYTAAECEPCQLAREHLAQRGVPYTEKRVEDAADLKAFRALGFDKALFPSASVGPEKLTGFESVGWDRALDATGYPRSSMLPAHREPRRVAPMREAADRPSAAAAETAPAAAGAETARNHADADRLLAPASFRTGPNPIRF